MTKLQAILKQHQRQRNTVPVLQAAAVVIVILAVVFFAFEYHYRTPDQKKQNTVLSVVHVEHNREFFRQLDLRDPSQIYGSGKRDSDTLPERDRRAGFAVTAVAPDRLPAVQLHPGKALTGHDFPVAPRLGVMPQTSAPVKKSPTATVAITPQGQVINLPALAKSTSQTAPAADSVIHIYRRGSVTMFRVMRSCGTAALDAACGRELVRRGDPEGVYTVIWSNKESREVKK